MPDTIASAVIGATIMLVLTSCVATNPRQARDASLDAEGRAHPPSELTGLIGDRDDDDRAGAPIEAAKDDHDADSDNDSIAKEPKTYYDDDDGTIRRYGRAATVAERDEISTLVTRYYRYERQADGAAACSLLYHPIAAAMAEEYGPDGSAPAYLRGTTCSTVMSKILEHNHSSIPASIVVTGVRISGDEGRVLFGSRTSPAAYIAVRPERSKWRIATLFVQQLP